VCLSAGKSTLINAFLGNEILPVNNVPETARICRIKHVPAASCPEPVLELGASGAGTSRTSSLASAGSACYDTAALASSPSISSSSDGCCSSQRSSMEHAEGESLVGAAAIREHLQQLNRDVRAREHMRNDEKVSNAAVVLVVVLVEEPTAMGGASDILHLHVVQVLTSRKAAAIPLSTRPWRVSWYSSPGAEGAKAYLQLLLAVRVLCFLHVQG